jgi:hypothetical protein
LSKNTSIATGVTSDPAGNVYVSGVAFDKAGQPHWVILRKPWSEPPVYDQKNSNVNITPQVFALPELTRVLASPSEGATTPVLSFGDSNGRWTLLQSVDAGKNWRLADIWEDGPELSTAYDAAYDRAHDRLYVVGCRGRTGGTSRTAWVVRMKEPDRPWVTLLDRGVEGFNQLWYATSVAVDQNGAVWIGGVITHTPGHPLDSLPIMKVIRWTPPPPTDPPPAPLSWNASFDSHVGLLETGEGGLLPFGLGTKSAGTRVTLDSAGNAFVSGSVLDLDVDRYRLAVVRLSPAQPTP